MENITILEKLRKRRSEKLQVSGPMVSKVMKSYLLPLFTRHFRVSKSEKYLSSTTRAQPSKDLVISENLLNELKDAEITLAELQLKLKNSRQATEKLSQEVRKIKDSTLSSKVFREVFKYSSIVDQEKVVLVLAKENSVCDKISKNDEIKVSVELERKINNIRFERIYFFNSLTQNFARKNPTSIQQFCFDLK